MGFLDVDERNEPVSWEKTYEVKKANHISDMQAKEDEMRQMFVHRVKEKEAELKEAEREVSFKIMILIEIKKTLNKTHNCDHQGWKVLHQKIKENKFLFCKTYKFLTPTEKSGYIVIGLHRLLVTLL